MELTRTPDIEIPPFRFVTADFDPGDRDALARVVEELLAREIGSAAELEQWVHDWSEVGRRVHGEHARRLTAMNRDTRDERARERHLAFQRELLPVWQQLEDRLNRRYLECPHRESLNGGFAVFDRIKAKEAEIFREENTELGAQDRALGARYQQIMGGLAVELRGETLTLQECSAKLQDLDRGLREEAFVASSEAIYSRREELDGIFDRMLELRQRAARNAGYDGFLEYGFALHDRFDYTPEDCARFHDAIEKVVVPAVRELRDLRASRLGIDPLRPWDRDVSLFGVEPKELFDDQDAFVDLAARVFRSVDEGFARDFDTLRRNGMLDLMSRPGKAPGGYNCAVDDIGLPFIFYNAVGRHRDLRVLLHEGGHAFHTLSVRDQPVQLYRSAPLEFAEVASMSMEMFGFERLHGLLEPEDYREFAFSQFSGALRVLASAALIDSFQAWLYRHPGHTPEERRAAWLRQADRFGAPVDWSGYERYRANGWQGVLHMFMQPLYYIEYAIAQLGALQLWRLERRDHAAAVAGYRRALALGGSRPLPQLFEAAGIRFAMDEAVLGELVPEVMARLRKLLAD